MMKSNHTKSGPALFSCALFKSLWRLLLIGVFEAALAVMLALQIKHTLGQYPRADGVMDGLITGAVILLAIVTLSGLSKWLERVEAERLGQNFVHRLRITLFDHLSRLSFNTLAKKRKGPLLLRFMNDLTALRQWVTLGLSRLVVAGVTTLVSISALYVIDADVALALTVLFFAAGLVAAILGRFINRSVRVARKRRSYLSSSITEQLLAMSTIQMLARRQAERRIFRRKSTRLRSAMHARASYIGLLRGLTRIVTSLSIIVAILISVAKTGGSTVAVGDMLAAISLVTFLSPALYDLGRVYEYWHSASVALEKINVLLHEGPTIMPPAKGVRARAKRGKLSFENVCVAGVLNEVNAQAKPGQKIALLGRNGGGKSTLLRLAMRLDDPDGGVIFLAGKNIAECGLGGLRRTVTLAANDAPLFSGTIESNLCYPGEWITLAEQESLLAKLGLDVFNPTSQFFKDRRVTEGGSNLSQGEIATILIARAFLIQPAVLLLDEIDIHLDDQMRLRFYTVLQDFQGTVIAASHDHSILACCDTVWSLQAGQIQSLSTRAYKREARAKKRRAKLLTQTSSSKPINAKLLTRNP